MEEVVKSGTFKVTKNFDDKTNEGFIRIEDGTGIWKLEFSSDSPYYPHLNLLASERYKKVLDLYIHLLYKISFSALFLDKQFYKDMVNAIGAFDARYIEARKNEEDTSDKDVEQIRDLLRAYNLTDKE